jgi:hypothetical protein
MGQGPLSGGYQPISWIHFGGSHGQSLKHIVGLSAQYYSCRLLRLQIIFHDTQNLEEALELGLECCQKSQSLRSTAKAESKLTL